MILMGFTGYCASAGDAVANAITAMTAQRRPMLGSPSALPYAGVDDDRLARGEVLQHALERIFLPEPAAFEAAVRQVRPRRDELVHLDEAGVDALGKDERLAEVARPQRRRQAEVAVIRLFEHLVEIAPARDD